MNEKNTFRWLVPLLLFIFIIISFLSNQILSGVGNFLIRNDTPSHSDAAVVLNTGVDYYPRLIESSELYKKGFVKKVVINGNRKSDVLRKLEKQGFKPAHKWYANSVAILKLLGVPGNHIITISAEDVYDTVSEAELVGKALIDLGILKIIITTSKFHTRRAGYIWEKAFSGQLEILTVAANDDPYDPDGWWKDGRQVRWVMAEYGAWLYYVWKKS